MVESSALLKRRTPKGYRGFESLPHRFISWRFLWVREGGRARSRAIRIVARHRKHSMTRETFTFFHTRSRRRSAKLNRVLGAALQFDANKVVDLGELNCFHREKVS